MQPATFLLIGTLIFTSVLLYRIQVLIHDSEFENREKFDRLRASHRRVTREYLEDLKRIDFENGSSMSSESVSLEKVTRLIPMEHKENVR